MHVLLDAPCPSDAALTWAGVQPWRPSSGARDGDARPGRGWRPSIRLALGISLGVHAAACLAWLSLDPHRSLPPPPLTLAVELMSGPPIPEPARAPAPAPADAVAVAPDSAVAVAPPPAEAVAVAPDIAAAVASSPANAVSVALQNALTRAVDTPLIAPAPLMVAKPVSPDAPRAPLATVPLRADPRTAGPVAHAASTARGKPVEARFNQARSAPASAPAVAQGGPSTLALAAPPALPQVVSPAHPIAGLASNLQPVYPEAALRRGEEGVVVLRVEVNTDGAATTLSVLRSSGHDTLDAAATAAVRQWRFSPATRDGTPLEAFADVPIAFHVSR